MELAERDHGGPPMRQPHVDDFVRLTCDIPDLSLHRGQIGVVCSTWCEPLTAYEVEFNVGLSDETRCTRGRNWGRRRRTIARARGTSPVGLY
jgi:hypothetical protein